MSQFLIKFSLVRVTREQGSHASIFANCHFPCSLPTLNSPSAWLPLSPGVMLLRSPAKKSRSHSSPSVTNSTGKFESSKAELTRQNPCFGESGYTAKQAPLLVLPLGNVPKHSVLLQHFSHSVLSTHSTTIYWVSTMSQPLGSQQGLRMQISRTKGA